MKIAYIVLKGMPEGGGIEKYTEEVGSRLAKKGHEVIVYTMRHYNARDGMYKGMRIKTVPSLNTRSFEKLTASFIATMKQCFEKKIDIVHFHAFGPAMFCFVPRLLGRKVVVQGHGLEWKRSRFGRTGRLFLKLAEIPSVKLPNVVTAVSRVQEEYLLNKHGVKCHYIPTGVNPPRIEKPDMIKEYYGLHGNDYILFVARLVKEKGAHYLIDAYKKLDTDLKLVIVGDAKHERYYKARLHRMAGDNKNIIFTNFIRGKILDELLSNCHLFVLPSEIEGLPTALIEAMSYSNCCLVSNIPENIEVMNNNGYTFRNKDKNDLLEKLNYLINNNNAIDTVREKARDHVLSKYSWDMVADKIEKLYKTTLGS